MILNICGGYRTENVVFPIDRPYLIPKFEEHQTAIEVLQGHENANFHLMITELQRIGWLDINIDQAMQKENEFLIISLWEKYINNVDFLCNNFQCPAPNLCPLILNTIIKQFIQHIHHGSRDSTTVITYSLNLLFLGLTNQCCKNNNKEIFELLSNYYIQIKIGNSVDITNYDYVIIDVLIDRNSRYLELIKNKNYLDKINDKFYLDSFSDKYDKFVNDIDLCNNYSKIQL